MSLIIDPYQKEALQREFIEAIDARGLILVSRPLAIHMLQLEKMHTALLKKKYLSPYQIAKHQLIPGKTTARTIKNMIVDGRIADGEWFLDKKGNYQVMTFAIKRLRNDEP